MAVDGDGDDGGGDRDDVEGGFDTGEDLVVGHGAWSAGGFSSYVPSMGDSK